MILNHYFFLAYLVDADEEQLDQKNKNVNNDEPTNIDNNEEKLKSSSNENTDNNNENNENNDNNDRTVRDTQNKGTVNSEKVTLEEQLNENLENTRDNVDSKNNYDDDLKPVEISKVKVIQDNVTGHKRSSFSEDKSSNRGDENTVSHIKEEVENRILEKQKNQDGDGEPLVAEDNDESSNVDLEESEHPDEQAPPDHDELPPEVCFYENICVPYAQKILVIKSCNHKLLRENFHDYTNVCLQHFSSINKKCWEQLKSEI